jgi:hypothetical protein
MVSPKAAEVPIGSLLRVMAVMVIVEMLAGLDDVVLRVSTELSLSNGVGGQNVAVTPLGRSLALSDTRVPRKYGLARNETTVVVAAPAWTVAEVELSFIVYSVGWYFDSLASADADPANASASAAGTTVDRSNVLRRICDTLGPPQTG